MLLVIKLSIFGKFIQFTVSTCHTFSTSISITYSQSFLKEIFQVKPTFWVSIKFTPDLSFTFSISACTNKREDEKHLKQTLERHSDWCASHWLTLWAYFQSKAHLGHWVTHRMVKSRKSWCSSLCHLLCDTVTLDPDERCQFSARSRIKLWRSLTWV